MRLPGLLGGCTLLLAFLAVFPAWAGRPILVRDQAGLPLLTDRPDPGRAPLPVVRPNVRSTRTTHRTAAWAVPYERLIRQEAIRAGIDPELLLAVVRHESGFDPRAVSPAGAMGLAQLMPATARRFGVVDPFDPAQNLRGGARYLSFLLDRYAGDLTLGLAGYHAGEGTVDRYGGVPPYPETRRYISRVLGELDGHHRRAAPRKGGGLTVRREGGVLTITN
jgi:soluble lytic murein transglycosylase-like protein